MDNIEQVQSEGLNALLQDENGGARNQEERYPLEHELGLSGPYFSVLKIKLKLGAKESGVFGAVKTPASEFSDNDIKLFRYAVLNVVKELLYKEWDALGCYSGKYELSILLQWSESRYAELDGNKIIQLEMIGRSLHHHVQKYLKIDTVIGISQILKGSQFLGLLSRQAEKAMKWGGDQGDCSVFYYGDFNWHNYAYEPSAEELTRQNNRIVENAKQYIEENYSLKGLTIHEVAKKSHVSPNYLSYLFKKNTGFSVWEYVIKLRMEESKSLILNTDLRRYEIAERVGYESPEHFSKIFKKYFGVSPTELKK
jgi:AraC-like DNA-binding protein